MLPANPAKVEVTKQKIRLRRLHLAPADLDQFTAFLSDFSAAHAKWKVHLAFQDTAVADRNKLISDFLLLIEQRLSPDGIERFKNYVQGEKTKMTIPRYDSK